LGNPRVLFVTSKVSGGMKTHQTDLLVGLKDSYDLCLLGAKGDDWPATLQESGCDFIPADAFQGYSGLQIGRGVAALWSALRRQKPDLLHIHGFRPLLYGLPLLSRTGPPVVMTVHGFMPGTAGLRSRLAALLMNQVPAKIIAVSKALRKHLISLGIDESKIEVVYNGIDLAEWKRRGDLPGVQGEFRLAAVGRLVRKKGFHHLLEATATLNRRGLATKLSIAGDGPEEGSLKALAGELGLLDRVMFLGHVKDLRPYLLGAHALAMPSLEEGLGIAAIEAMALSIPVVATATGGLSEVVVADETGYLVEAGDEQELVDAIWTMARSGDKGLRRMGDAGRQRAERLFSRQGMIEGTGRIYRSLLEAAYQPTSVPEGVNR